jgi:predicted transcriptional regulator
MNKKTLTIDSVVKTLALEVQSGQESMLTEVAGGYCSDLLSDVMANSKKGDLWVTYQIHPNIVAVAVLKELAGIIITGGRKPDAATVKKAQTEKMAVLCSPLATFEVVGKLFTLGVSGSR